MNINKFNEQDNDWAKDITGEYLHISQAVSGANNYFCLGCDKEMLAAKGKIKKHYFRHVVKDVNNSKVECVHASRVYREKLAYFHFQRTKTITVPAVYKYPPKGVEGHPILLKEKEIVTAHRVERELTFFEDENGVIHRGKNSNIGERFLWVRPDAVFFDEDDKPILFLEFVITHKPDLIKLNKLQRLGIDTVQIIIPKLPEEELEKAISKVSKIKWTFNEIESNTEYIPLQSGDTEGVPQIDEDQRKLFEESFSCRATQIGNLIRSINRSLGSQQYRNTEYLFESEIQRIEEATREHESRLEQIRAGIETEIYSELEDTRKEFDTRREQFQNYSSSLEKRYYRRKREIEEEQKYNEREIELRYSVGESEEQIRSRFENEKRIIEEDERRIRSLIDSDRSFDRNFEDEERRIEHEFEELQNEFTERIRTRDFKGDDELSRRIKKSIEALEHIGHFEEKKRLYERYRHYQEVIRNGAWKKW